MKRAAMRVMTSALAIGASSHLARAQSTHQPNRVAATRAAGSSTLSGVYTNEQASRGKDVYAGSCRSCHVPASHTGATFATWWRGKQLSDLFTFVSTRMPKNDPGSLAPEDAADVVAYLLKMNAMPAGAVALPADIDSLKKIRIAVKSASRHTTTRTKG